MALESTNKQHMLTISRLQGELATSRAETLRATERVQQSTSFINTFLPKTPIGGSSAALEVKDDTSMFSNLDDDDNMNEHDSAPVQSNNSSRPTSTKPRAVPSSTAKSSNKHASTKPASSHHVAARKSFSAATVARVITPTDTDDGQHGRAKGGADVLFSSAPMSSYMSPIRPMHTPRLITTDRRQQHPQGRESYTRSTAAPSARMGMDRSVNTIERERDCASIASASSSQDLKHEVQATIDMIDRLMTPR